VSAGAAPIARELEGGCACGAVRYRVSGEASNPCFCHCRSCRRAAGAPLVAWATFDARRFRYTRGEARRHASSPEVRRGFCGACGTPLSYEHGQRTGEIDLTLASLDDPGALAPQCHIWVSHKLPWVALDDGLPRHAEWRQPPKP
jgi:hypothetical protein